MILLCWSVSWNELDWINLSCLHWPEASYCEGEILWHAFMIVRIPRKKSTSRVAASLASLEASWKHQIIPNRRKTRKKTQFSMDHMDHMGQSGKRTVETSLHLWLGRLCDRPLNLPSIPVQHLRASRNFDLAAVIEVLLWKSCHLFTLLLQLMQSLLLKAKLHHLQQIYSR